MQFHFEPKGAALRVKSSQGFKPMTEEVGRVRAGASHICCKEHKRAFGSPGRSVLRDALPEVRLVIADAADDGGEAEEAGGRRRLTVSWKNSSSLAPLCWVAAALWQKQPDHVPSLWLMMAEWSAEVGQASEAFFQR